MSEMAFRRKLVKGLREDGAHVQPLEVMMTKGVPDVNWCAPDTWAELKFLRKFPVRPTTNVTLTDFKWEQVWWLVDRGKAGGRSLLISQIGKEYFVHSWACCVAIKEGMNTADFRANARLATSDFKELIQFCRSNK